MAGEMAERIGARIRARRIELGLNQRELADRMPPAVSGQHISNWERSVNRPGDRNIELLAAALEVDVSYFYAPEQDKPEDTPNLMGVLNGEDPSQLDRIEAKLDQVLAHLSEEAVNASLAGLRGQLAKVTAEIEALRLDQASADMEAQQRHEAAMSELAQLRSRRPA